MPAWLTLIPSIISAVIQLIKLIMELKKKNPVAAKDCSEALATARKSGDGSAMQHLLDKMGKGENCD
jgi:hypothetical protein